MNRKDVGPAPLIGWSARQTCLVPTVRGAWSLFGRCLRATQAIGECERMPSGGRIPPLSSSLRVVDFSAACALVQQMTAGATLGARLFWSGENEK
jgi:hypothetical protein